MASIRNAHGNDIGEAHQPACFYNNFVIISVVMTTVSKTTFQDWQEQQEQDPDFVAESLELEIGYQIARLRILQGLTQEELAERVGTRQPSIARLESGRSLPSLSFLEKIADALDAKMEIRIVPKAVSR